MTRLLFIGDVVGRSGRAAVLEQVPFLRARWGLDFVIVNGENAAGGFGLTPSLAEELFDMGAHVITTGNHIWDKKEIFEYMAVPADSHVRGRRVLRSRRGAGLAGVGLVLLRREWLLVAMVEMMRPDPDQNPDQNPDHRLR